jgi:molybdopterin molybdotransferase
MITVAAALEHLFALADPLGVEMVPLRAAAGRILAQPVAATRDQPPFAASAMDGYAVGADQASTGQKYDVIGEAAAGRRFSGKVGPGQAVRIFTGAPLPDGTGRVIIQEDVTRLGDTITLGASLDTATHVRPTGADFHAGDTIAPPRRLTPSDVALLAAMNVANVPVTRKPMVAIIATGDELVQPGETPAPDQIIASNSYGLDALLRELGADTRLLPIARDTVTSLQLALDLAADADLIITIGGASVGDYDLVGQVAQDSGMQQAFYKIAMRPGKPLMAGRLKGAAMIGLPGNPVSAMVCGHVFVAPVVRRMLGLPACATPRRQAPLAHDLPANGPREHYMRGHDAQGSVTVFLRQDSALLTVLAAANCLVVRPVGDPARKRGDMVELIDI